MGRLANLKPQVASLPDRLGRQTDAHGHSATTEPWRRWYSSAEWAELRKATFIRDSFTCQMTDCGVFIADRRELVCDHVRRHRGDRRLFFAPANLQTLCKTCHDTKKQRLERRSLG